MFACGGQSCEVGVRRLVTIGIDVGGTNLVAGVVDAQGRLLAKACAKTPRVTTPQPIIDVCVTLARRACHMAGVAESDVGAIGFGVPGSVDRASGGVVRCCNIPFVDVPLRQVVQAQWNVPVFVENDANAAALGEATVGSARGYRHVLLVTLGTGVGGGILIDGKIYGGHNHLGAELGHTVIVHNGRRCGCGRYGCWEAYASASALTRDTRAAMRRHRDSKLWQSAQSLERVNARTAFDAMRQGDAVATALVERYVDWLACGLTNIVNVLQPEVVCIGGGVSNEGDALLLPLAERVRQGDYNKTDDRVDIRKAALGNDAGVIGAALGCHS